MRKAFDYPGYLISGIIFLLMAILTWPLGTIAFALPAVFMLARYGAYKAIKAKNDPYDRKKFIKGCYISTGVVAGFGLYLAVYASIEYRYWWGLSIDGTIHMFIAAYIIILGLLAMLAIVLAAKACGNLVGAASCRPMSFPKIKHKGEDENGPKN